MNQSCAGVILPLVEPDWLKWLHGNATHKEIGYRVRARVYFGKNSSSSACASYGKIETAFKFSEWKQDSGCKFRMSSGAGAGVTFLEQEQE